MLYVWRNEQIWYSLDFLFMYASQTFAKTYFEENSKLNFSGFWLKYINE